MDGFTDAWRTGAALPSTHERLRNADDLTALVEEAVALLRRSPFHGDAEQDDWMARAAVALRVPLPVLLGDLYPTHFCAVSGRPVRA